MHTDPKTTQLQIRVSPSQKSAIRMQAEKARMSMSDWILSKLLPSPAIRFQAVLTELSAADQPGYAFAELLDLLDSLTADAFALAVDAPPQATLSLYWANYVAATVEHAAVIKQARIPAWTREIPPLDEPHFGSELLGLRLHLLIHSPAAFAQRNIFIDSTVGDRV